MAGRLAHAELGIRNFAHPPERISDFGFRICRPTACILRREAAVGVALLRRASSRGPRDVTCGNCILPVRGARLCPPRGAFRAPSTRPNQPRRPSITPTSRKGAAGPARRGFPRAGGRGVGAGKRSSKVPPGSNAARRRAPQAHEDANRCDRGTLAFRERSGERPWPRSKDRGRRAGIEMGRICRES